MKGVIVLALRELVVNKFGQDKWKEILAKSGIDKEPLLLPITNVDDETVLKVVGSLCDVLNVTLPQAADAFGDYWVNVYSQKTYPLYYENVTTAKEFILKMDYVHTTATNNIPDAKPPRFNYTWNDDKTLIMEYKSHRGLIDFMIGLVKGVGNHYNEELKVTKLDNDKIEIVFQ